MKLGACFLLLCTIAMAQTAETIIYRVVLLPANEVPAINNPARGVADVIASVVRDAAGQIVSGNIDVLLRTTLAAANTATGLNLHNGATGQTVPIALSTGLSTANSRPLQTGADSIRIPIPVKGDNPAALAMLRALVQDPAKFYLNMTSTDQPNGLMRGQLVKAQVAVLMAMLSSGNVTPPAANSGSGFGQVVAIGTRDAGGQLDLRRSLPVGHRPPTIPPRSTASTFTWARRARPAPSASPPPCRRAPRPIPTAPPCSARSTPRSLPTTPRSPAPSPTSSSTRPRSIWTCTRCRTLTAFCAPNCAPPTARPSRCCWIPPANPSPPAVRALAPANLTLYTLRNQDGTIAAGTLLTDLCLRFPSRQQFLGLYIHDAGCPGRGADLDQGRPRFFQRYRFRAATMAGRRRS